MQSLSREHRMSLTACMLVEDAQLMIVRDSPAFVIGHVCHHLQAGTPLVRALHHKSMP